MSTATPPKQYTPDDLLRMPDGDRYELVDGQLVERHMSYWSSYLAGQMYWLLRRFCQGDRFSWITPEGTSYQSFPQHPNRVRKPDVSLIRFDRLSTDQAMREGHVSVVPDLAVEVVSPNDLYYEVDEKVAEWLEAGVQLVWVINPRNRTVRVHRPDGAITTLREHEVLRGEPVVPDFQCQVEEIFRPAPGAAPVS
jgi:Uma2 family endonuclease